MDIKRPTLFRSLARWTVGSLAVIFLVGAAMVIVNLVDYAPHWLALRRAHRLEDTELRQLAEACTRYEQRGPQKTNGDSIPPEFRTLRPHRVVFYPGATDITLYDREYQYIFLRVATTAENQTITCVSHGPDRQRRHILWEKNPEVTARLNPRNRLVTFTEYNMNLMRRWTVLPTHVQVIEGAKGVGTADQIAAEVPLNPTQRAALEHALHSVGPDVRGHAFNAGVIDGVSLHVTFSPTGAENESDDIVLDNAWRPELAPLVDAISAVVGPAHAIRYPETIQRREVLEGESVEVLPLASYNRRDNAIPLPWWCWWPRFAFTADPERIRR